MTLTTTRRLKVVGDDQEHACANATDAIRIGYRADPTGYVRNCRIECDAVMALELEEHDEAIE